MGLASYLLAALGELLALLVGEVHRHNLRREGLVATGPRGRANHIPNGAPNVHEDVEGHLEQEEKERRLVKLGGPLGADLGLRKHSLGRQACVPTHELLDEVVVRRAVPALGRTTIVHDCRLARVVVVHENLDLLFVARRLAEGWAEELVDVRVALLERWQQGGSHVVRPARGPIVWLLLFEREFDLIGRYAVFGREIEQRGAQLGLVERLVVEELGWIMRSRLVSRAPSARRIGIRVGAILEDLGRRADDDAKVEGPQKAED